MQRPPQALLLVRAAFARPRWVRCQSCELQQKEPHACREKLRQGPPWAGGTRRGHRGPQPWGSVAGWCRRGWVGGTSVSPAPLCTFSSSAATPQPLHGHLQPCCPLLSPALTYLPWAPRNRHHGTRSRAIPSAASAIIRGIFLHCVSDL